jgi:hypothetical protein
MTTTYTPTTEKKSPMPTNTTSTTATSTSRSTAMNLINEALSRTRMRSPQIENSEARRPARRVAIEARRQQARELGNLSLYGVR